MTTSGTTTFSPSVGETTLFAFALCGLRRSEIVQQHLTDARMAANLMLADWNNATPNLWKVSEVVQSLVQGVATYNVDPATITMLDAFIRINPGTDGQFDRIIWPISRTEYASLPNKELQAPPTVFWYDKLLAPTVTLWQVPPATGFAELHYYQVTQIFDANTANGETLDMPVWWLRAFAYGLAEGLSHIYAPDRTQLLERKTAEYLEKAMTQNTEQNNTLILAPSLFGFYSR